MKNILIILLFAILLGAAGCSSVPRVNMQFLKIQQVKYHDSTGKLDIRGIYTEKGQGLSQISAVRKNKTIELTAVPVEKGKRKIACRIPVPAEVTMVRFGEKVLWKRPEVKKTEKTPPVQKTEKTVTPEKADKKTEPVKKVVPEKKEESVPPEKVEKVIPEQKEPEKKEPEKTQPAVITALYINSGEFFKMECDDFTFEELFWGKDTSHKPEASGIKIIGSRKEPVEFNAALINNYPDLQVLKIKGNIWDSCDFSGVNLPKLKKLVIDDLEVKGLEKASFPALEEFFLNDRRSVPLGKVALPEKLEKLHTAGIQSFSGNFDFASLAGKPVKVLRIHSDLRRFDFLKGLSVEKLHISGFTADAGTLKVLHELPLKSLIIEPYRMNDWGFLAGMKLQFLDILSRSNGNFSPELLVGMPLETLRLRMPPKNYDREWMSLLNLPLKELVLRNAYIPLKFLSQNRSIESLGMINCRWKFAEPAIVLGRMPKLRHLAAWQIIYQLPGKTGKFIDHQISWGRFANRKLRSLAVATPDVRFIRQMPAVDKVAIRFSGESVIQINGLENRRFEVFFCPDMPSQLKHRLKQDMVRNNIKVKSAERKDILPAW